MIWHEQPSEPRHTIYLDRWREAQARLRGLDAEPRRLLTELLAHVDAGWKHLRQLQLAAEDLAKTGTPNAALRDALGFIDADVVDTYREIAFDAADLVPGWDGWAQAADPGSMDGDASLFIRYLGVLRLAAASEELPRQLRDVSTRVWAELEGWEAGFTRLLRAIDETVILPSLPEQAPLFIQSRIPSADEDSTSV